MKDPKLPKKVFVRWEGGQRELYLAATETIAGIDDGKVVGVYELVEVKTKKVTEVLV